MLVYLEKVKCVRVIKNDITYRILESNSGNVTIIDETNNEPWKTTREGVEKLFGADPMVFMEDEKLN